MSYADDGATESCWWWCHRGDLATVQCKCWVILVMVLPSHVGDGAAGVTWLWRDVDAESCCWWCYWVMPMMVLPGRFGRGVMYMPSHTGDGAFESCWWWHYQGDLAVMRCRCRVLLAMMLPSDACNYAATQGCTCHVKVAQPPSSEHRGVVTLKEVGLACQSLMMFMLAHNWVIGGKIS
jgi:hypothetical protein